jgi:tetratricopeptide (TPR) repeat protein
VVSPPAPVPAQLPAQVVGFVGRGAELTRLDALLPGDGWAGAAVVISAVSGMAGVGKTALALHWAHRVAPRFPDGQLYVNLRGFGPDERTAAPADVLRSLLGALGVAPDRLPHDLDGRASLFRTLLAGKQILLVLDNARDSDQVRPLLPGTATALTVVTSRNPLTGLVVEVGAHPLTLDVLPTVDARELLVRRLGSDRIDAEPEAVNAIIAACARLPLALAIAAAHAQRTGFRLSAFAAELAPDRRLGALDTGEAGGQIRAVFSWSYATLTSAAACLLRHLGLHVGDDISAAAAASLAGIPADRARELLAELVYASLVTEHMPGRFACHDLLRAYAAEMSGRIESAEQRHLAVHRVLDHYLHTAHAADVLLNPRRDRITVAPPQPGVTAVNLSGHDQALAWFSAEHHVLLSAIDRASACGFDVHTWQLARAVSTFLHRRGHWHDRATTQHLAVAAARKLGDTAAEARAHLILGDTYTSLTRFSDAFTHFKLALDRYERTGDELGRALTLYTIAHLWERQDNHTEALRYASRALEIFRAAGHRLMQAAALNELGWHYTSLGEHHLALASCQQALVLFEELDDPAGQAATWDSLGYAYRRMGKYPDAASCYRRAVDLHRGLGDRYEEADTLASLGDAQRDAGDTTAAERAWQRAIDILTELDHPDAARIRDKLDRVARRHDGQTAHEAD